MNAYAAAPLFLYWGAFQAEKAYDVRLAYAMAIYPVISSKLLIVRKDHERLTANG